LHSVHAKVIFVRISFPPPRAIRPVHSIFEGRPFHFFAQKKELNLFICLIYHKDVRPSIKSF